MLLKLGVDISRLSRPLRRKLSGIDEIFKLMSGHEAVVTSTYGGDHAANSLHYSNEAIDLRLTNSNNSEVVIKLRQYLGKNFDVIPEVDHIHVEFDPKSIVVKGGE